MPCSPHPLSDDAPLLSEETRQANVRYLKSWLAALERRNPAELVHMGFPETIPSSVDDKYPGECWIKHSLEMNWQLCKTLRWSQPRRLAEAVPSLTWLLDYQMNMMTLETSQKDLNMSMFLAVGLSDAGRVAEAETVFVMTEKALALHPDALEEPAVVYLKANHARNLRFLGRTEEALPLEKWVVNLFNTLPRAYMANDVIERVTGPGDDLLHHPVLDQCDWVRGAEVLNIRCNKTPLEAFEALTLKPVPLAGVLRQAAMQAKAQVCDPQNMDLQICYHSKGPLQGKLEMRPVPRFQHPPPLTTVVAYRTATTNQPILRPLPSDPFEINQEDVKECWLTRCGKTKDLKLCTKCYTARYCGAEHQTKAWKLHKVNCKAVYRVANMLGESKVEAPEATREPLEKGKKLGKN